MMFSERMIYRAQREDETTMVRQIEDDGFVLKIVRVLETGNEYSSARGCIASLVGYTFSQVRTCLKKQLPNILLFSG